MKKMLFGIWLLCLLFSFQCVFADGTCGKNIIYRKNGNTITYLSREGTIGEWDNSCIDYANDVSIEIIKIGNRIYAGSGHLDFCHVTHYYTYHDTYWPKNIKEMYLSNLDVSDVTSMAYTFSGYGSLVTLDISGWDTSSVTNMEMMFQSVSSLENMDLNILDTSSVVNMRGMFAGCSSENLDLNNWDTSSVTNMEMMFSNCKKLEIVKIQNWDTSSVTNMAGMFLACDLMKRLDLNNWDTSSVTNMKGMFYSCDSLISVDINKWDTSKVERFDEMFMYCSSLTNLDLNSWNVSNVQDIDRMFQECSSLNNLKLNAWNTSNMQRATAAFAGCSSLQSLDLSGWNTSKVSDVALFDGCNSLYALKLGKNTLIKNIFTSLPSYKDTWYYIEPGSAASNPLKIKTSKSNTSLFTNYDPDTMAGTWSTDKDFYGFKNPLSEDQYLIIVVDENGDPLSGATVTWEKQEAETGADGSVIFNAYSFRQPHITVTKDGYTDWDNKDVYWEKSEIGREKIILYPEKWGKDLKLKSARYSANQDMSMSTDLLTKTKKVSLGNEISLARDLDNEEFYLACKANKPSEASSYELWQNEKMIANSENGNFKLNIEDFSKGARCFIRVIGKDGTARFDTNINLVFDMAEKNKATELSFNGSTLSFAVADTVPYLGGSKLDVDIPRTKLPITGIISGNKIRLGFNMNFPGGKSKEDQIKKIKEKIEKLSHLGGLTPGKMNDEKFKIYQSMVGELDKFTSRKFKSKFIERGELNFLGYAEGDWSSGTASGALIIVWKQPLVGLEFNTWCVVVPVTAQVDLKFDGTGTARISYDWKMDTFDFGGNLQFVPQLKAFGGFGVSELVGVGAYGSAELEWKLEIFPTFDTDSLDLTGELGIKAYLGPETFEKPFAYNTWHLYSRTNPKEIILSEEVTEKGIENKSKPVSNEIYNASQYHKADFSYLSEEADHMRPKVLSSKAVDSDFMTFEKLIENTYRNAQPAAISADNAAYAAFLRADTSGRVYTVVSKNDGSGWTEPVEVSSSDVFADAPKLIADARDRIWLAYARTGSSYNNSSLSNWAGSQELVVGLLDSDTLSFSPYRVYNGDYVHMHTFSLVNGAPTLVWLSSQVQTDNDVLWPKSSTIYNASYDGTDWSDAEALETVDHVIIEMAAGEENSSLSVGYVIDSDNSYDTTDDRKLMKLTNGEMQTLFGSASAISFGVLPGSDSAGFIWNDGGTLHNEAGSVDETTAFTNEYSILENNIYYSAASEKGADLCLIRYENGAWSQPILLTDEEGYLENINAVRINGKDYVLGMYTTPVIGENNIEDSKDLVWSDVPAVSDIMIESVDYEDEALEPEQRIPVTLTVRNDSDHPVASLDIMIDGQIISTQAVNLGLGESIQITINITVPSEVHTYRLTAVETGNTNYHSDADAIEFALGCPDLTVSLEWENVGERTNVVAAVQNVGISPTAGKLTLFDLSGAVLSETLFSEMAPGERVFAELDIDWDKIPEKKYDVRALVESFEEESVFYNNDDYIHLTYFDPLPTQPAVISLVPDGMIILKIGETYQLAASVLPEEADQNVVWTSSDDQSVKVDQNGLITGLSEASNVVITVTSVTDPTVTASIIVNVISETEPVNPSDPQPDEEPDPCPDFWCFDHEGHSLPHTGFSAVRTEILPAMPGDLNYKPLHLTLEIPSISAAADILEVPYVNGEYPITWLGGEVGLLEGSARPGEGYTILTGHNHLNNMEAGPFALLSFLSEGDRVFVRDAKGRMKTYVIYANEKIGEMDYKAVETISVKYADSLTMITCEDERPEGGYANRRVVAARPIQ